VQALTVTSSAACVNTERALQATAARECVTVNNKHCVGAVLDADNFQNLMYRCLQLVRVPTLIDLTLRYFSKYGGFWDRLRQSG